jgi:hypothetical protein
VFRFRLLRRSVGANDVWLPPEGRLLPSARSYTDKEDVEPGHDYTYTLVVYHTLGGEVRSTPLPVTTVSLPVITEFSVTPAAGHVRLDWELDSDEIVSGFRIRRACAESPDTWLPADSLLTPQTRSFSDSEVLAGQEYSYTLVVYLTLDGEVESQPESVSTEPLPKDYGLGQNHPNPFNPDTQIPYAIRDRTLVTLEVFDAGGRRVRTILHEYQNPGFRSATWDGRDSSGKSVPSGVYFYRLRAGDFTSTRKMVVVR